MVMIPSININWIRLKTTAILSLSLLRVNRVECIYYKMDENIENQRRHMVGGSIGEQM